MTKKSSVDKSSMYLSIGFVFFFVGILLDSFMGEYIVMQMAGVALLIVAAAFFGLSLKYNKRREEKKK